MAFRANDILISVSGTLDAESGITTVATPVSDNHAATKAYADSKMDGARFKIGRATFDSAYTSSITFTEAYSGTDYSVMLAAQESISTWVTNKVSGGFTINVSSPLTGDIEWMTVYDSAQSSSLIGHTHLASDVSADTTNFDNNLSSADDTVQKALNTLNDLSVGGTSGWTDDGTVVRLDASDDDVAIGVATMLGTEKLRVVGAVVCDGSVGDTPNLGAGVRMTWSPARSAFRSGIALDTEWDGTNVGLTSFASGYGVKAKSSCAVAFGNQTTAWAANALAMGQSTQAYAPNGLAVGKESRTFMQCAIAQASGMFGSAGDAQSSTMVLRRQTTNATPAEVTLDGAVPNGNTNRIKMQWNSANLVSVHVIARRSDVVDESAAWKLEFCADKANGEATAALVGGVLKTVIGNDNSGVWDANASVETTTGCVTITVTGQASKTINWVAFARVTESKIPV